MDLPESGNLFANGIPLNFDTLFELKSRGMILCLKTGDFGKFEGNSKIRKYREDLVKEIHSLYVSGQLYLPDFLEVLGFHKVSTIRDLFRRYGLKNLSDLEARAFFADKIRERSEKTSLGRYGATNPTKSKDIRERAKQTSLKLYGVTNPAKSPEIKSSHR